MCTSNAAKTENGRKSNNEAAYDKTTTLKYCSLGKYNFLFQGKLTGLEVHYGMGLLITVSLDKTIKVLRLSSLEEVCHFGKVTDNY